MLKRIKVGELIRGGKAHSQTGPFGTQLKASEYVEEGIPVINVRNIGFGDVRKEQLEYLDDEKAAQLKSHLLKKDDIVFGRKGAVERHSLIGENETGWIQGSDCIRLRFLTDEYNPTFISFFFRTLEHQQWMINLGSFGATMGSLNQEIISKIEIPDVPRFIQDKIASILSAYDELLENNNQRISLLEQMTEEIYKEWFVRLRFPGYENTPVVDGVPEGWQKTNLGNVTSMVNRGISPAYDDEGNSYVLNQRCIRDNKIDYSLSRCQSKRIPKDRLLRLGDIVVNSTGEGTLGRVAQVWEQLTNFSVDSHVTIVRPVSATDAEFLGINMNLGQKLIENMALGSTGQTELNRTDLARLQVLYPDRATLTSFSELVNPIITEIQVLVKKNNNLKQTRDLLLPRLISGKLSVEHLLKQKEQQLQLAI
ncbi:restriction endonuclease subunit S [Pontibacter sp. JH31]|uniref:Restriction endonuclease subunit S n=1 Tax=Pontibacter aquaedesilientis TaxID=2766980 RepID=A0ABR7XKN2_9BACT|nr:restriction endonuclease subunit S [Pontibacter aquaedesilientis]MBD1398835.1 restriction endonuclease subunit S [Pontibacter aquaedesilientis]